MCKKKGAVIKTKKDNFKGRPRKEIGRGEIINLRGRRDDLLIDRGVTTREGVYYTMYRTERTF